MSRYYPRIRIHDLTIPMAQISRGEHITQEIPISNGVTGRVLGFRIYSEGNNNATDGEQRFYLSHKDDNGNYIDIVGIRTNVPSEPFQYTEGAHFDDSNSRREGTLSNAFFSREHPITALYVHSLVDESGAIEVTGDVEIQVVVLEGE